MATKAQLLTRCADLNIDDITIKEIFGGPDVEIWAPAGMIFEANQCHVILAHGEREDGATFPDMYDAALHDLSCGLLDCDDPDCEQCAENSE